ncbi:peptidoglycan binding protein CsiV [Shewanella litorisediminis]|uniref:Peptidoglycan binding protein CsiV n=1 Tax=Shewanella litorisediminis TaxID=1173586 RepID=A0ABX7G6R8_9GAMM|nr:peptidoglycan binding protein CsiV [Shewanella litorisediminis]MCL2916770.1 peptidoglycan binding protein CsiV [Shewanella litorisediminis]QRH03062.1 peptidoglycan binding protein CsiV [Shewanella litorisediminis]
MIRKLAMSAAFCLLPLSQAMAESWFEVEVFLFERNQPSAEEWPEQTRLPAFAKGRDLISPVLVPRDASLVPCSEEERIVDSLRCDAMDMQITSVTPSYPSPMPVKVVAPSQRAAEPGAGALLMDSTKLQFNDAVRQLSRESGITPLLHMSWQQAMQPRHASTPIRLFGGENFADRFTAMGTLRPAQDPVMEAGESSNAFGLTITSDMTQDTAGSNSGDSQALIASDASGGTYGQLQTDNGLSSGTVFRHKTPDPVWQLDGLINIYLSHYLYIESDLVLRTPGTRKVAVEQELLASSQSDTLAAGASATKSGQQIAFEEQPFLFAIPLTQNRRVRSGQVHYFDHPKLGMVIQIRKMAQPTGAVDVEEPAAEPEGDDTPEADVINQQTQD